MASEAERDAILAEYMQAANNGDDEDEDDFHDDYSDSDDDEHEHGGGEVKSKMDENYAVLDGTLHINEEGRLVYAGTWTMKKDLEAKDGDQHEHGNGNDNCHKKEKDSKKKKKTKFKLKSKQILCSTNGSYSGDTPSGTNSKFDLTNPVSQEEVYGGETNDAGKENATAAKQSMQPQLRSILCDGFFTTDDTDKIQPHRKVKERDVQITFYSLATTTSSSSSNSTTTTSTSISNRKCFKVEGIGSNEFGRFKLEGFYNPSYANVEDRNGQQEKSNNNASQALICNKHYIPAVTEDVKRKRNRNGKTFEDSEDDYEISDDGGAEYDEIIDLHEEAELSVEELRKKYYGGGGDVNDCADDSNGSKRRKIMDEEDDDDLGF